MYPVKNYIQFFTILYFTFVAISQEFTLKNAIFFMGRKIPLKSGQAGLIDAQYSETCEKKTIIRFYAFFLRNGRFCRYSKFLENWQNIAINANNLFYPNCLTSFFFSKTCTMVWYVRVCKNSFPIFLNFFVKQNFQFLGLQIFANQIQKH